MEKVIKISGKSLHPKFVEMHESDRDSSREIYARKPDISKAQKLLGFNPEISEILEKLKI